MSILDRIERIERLTEFLAGTEKPANDDKA
jgi:hypothetical protein